MTKKPSYRFVGYTEPWEQRKLGDVSTITMGQSPNSENYTDNPNDYILVQGNADMKNGRVFPRVWTTQITKQARQGDLILSVRAPVGDIGKTDYDVVLGRGVASIDGNEFLYQALSQMKQNGYWSKLSTGSTFESINSNDIKSAIISLPSLPEQTAIGSFFQDIDQLISLQQRKLEVLKEQKKTYLKLLFPAKGQTKPALRFAGFEDEWKEVKLGEVFKISSGFTGDSSLHSGSYKLTRIETISDDLINVKKLGYSNVAPDDSYKLGIGEILFSNINSIEHIGKVALYDKDYGLYHGINLLRLQPIDVNGIFSFYELGTIEKRNWARSHANKAVNQASINQTILSSLNLQIPSLPEQEAIGSFFQDLDKAIAKQEEKVNQLKESKQTLLRKMFI
ncbi:restriction endonuclease subunit S [Streptococcus mitis]|uniref:EcoKI restriction-modification system protein HsdS n=1 Tax=Streptococcus mitis TaxID=28037 RepID=A0A3R9IP07_STRMT|nr:restriction endonuclease subunit S [Streptococcus mitis]RSI85729.1 EcoKI restriction-modification system protein HsdS [Streptococcus mitis]RSI89666.1 EcoKI restriction-modification system protein HsdS [Streptococcus mitis]